MRLYKRNEAMHVEASPEDVVTAFRELPQTTQMRASLTLPQRMREAAKVLREVDERTPEWDDPPWHPTTLCRMAARWEAEAARAVARDVAVEELARLLHDLSVPGPPFDEASSPIVTCYRSRAEKLFAAGYRKQATDE